MRTDPAKAVNDAAVRKIGANRPEECDELMGWRRRDAKRSTCIDSMCDAEKLARTIGAKAEQKQRIRQRG